MNNRHQSAMTGFDTLGVDHFKTMKRAEKVAFFNSLTGYKSVLLVGTEDEQGHSNVAPFSSVFHLGADPALIGLIVRPDSSPRHTLSNISVTGYYTLNHVQEPFLERAHQASARYGRHFSEFSEVGLTPEYSTGIRAPYVAESPLKIGLRLRQVVPIEANDTRMVIGEVMEVLMTPNCRAEDGSIDYHTLATIAVTGLDHYHQPKSLVKMAYAKPPGDKRD